MPFRVDFIPVGPDIDVTENVRANSGYPAPQPTGKHRLAVVGGGPSVADHLPELKSWDGDIWAINHTAKWLHQQGIECTLFTIDPYLVDGAVDNAILASVCDPRLVTQCKNVRVFDLVEQDSTGITGGSTSAGRVPLLALRLRYIEVHFFGCEGSFAETDHVDREEGQPKQVIIRAGGKDYRTYPTFLNQCLELGEVLSTFPGVFIDRSGGLLAAILDNPDTWEVVAVSAALKDDIILHSGDYGIFDNEYRANV